MNKAVESTNVISPAPGFGFFFRSRADRLAADLIFFYPRGKRLRIVACATACSVGQGASNCLKLNDPAVRAPHSGG
jgi:hypothetical protein